jgi:Ca2+-binding RTX toxin-like protein
MVDVAASTKTTATLEGFGAGLGSYSGELEFAGDHDWIKVELTSGQAYQFFLCFQNTGDIYGDAFLTLRDADGQVVDAIDNGGVGTNSLLPIAVSQTGTYYLDISESGDDETGSYTLVAMTSDSGILLNSVEDIYTGGPANPRIVAGAGADTIDIGGAVDALGDQGNDILLGNAAVNKIFGALGEDFIDGRAGTDFLFGDAGNDTIDGGDDDDTMVGGPGNDTVFGGAGNDVILGGAGRDLLRGNGATLGSSFDLLSDTFVFNAVAESRRGAARDVIFDFASASEGIPGVEDTINLAGIDAKTGGINNAFKFIGTKPFHDKKGELRYKIDVKHDFTLIQGDVNGDGKADLEIQLTGQVTLIKGDFFL